MAEVVYHGYCFPKHSLCHKTEKQNTRAGRDLEGPLVQGWSNHVPGQIGHSCGFIHPVNGPFGSAQALHNALHAQGTGTLWAVVFVQTSCHLAFYDAGQTM